MAETKRGPGRPPGSKNKNTKGKTASKANAKAKAQEIQAKKNADKRVIDEIWAIITIAIGAFLVVASFTGGAGKLGEMIALGLKGLFGFMAYVLPFYLILFGILLFARQTSHFSVETIVLLFVMLLMLCTMNSIRFIEPEKIIWSMEDVKGFYVSGEKLLSGGFFGMLLGSVLIMWLGKGGCWIFTVVVTIICLLLIINTPVSRFFEKIGSKIEERKLIKEHAHLDMDTEDEQGIQTVMNNLPGTQSAQAGQKRIGSEFRDTPRPASHEIKIVSSGQPQDEYIPPSHTARPVSSEKKNSILKYMNDDSLFGRQKSSTTGLEDKTQTEEGFGLDNMAAGAAAAGTAAAAGMISQGVYDRDVPDKLSNKEAREAMLTAEEMNPHQTVKKYKKPPISLLERSSGGARTNNSLLASKARKLEETLRNFHVDARVVQVTQGPTVTRYEIQPAVGVKVNSIVRLADDIALNLEAKSIRIEAPIPGKAAVGIEVENDNVTMVRLREIIDSDEFRNSKSKITFAVGRDISGKAIVADLKAMPHLLIAGSTGSGKSVCINGIITSLLYKANPDEVKLILVDPKVVELGNYNGIPHLLIPVVTDPSKAAAALNWAVAEMTDRYKKFAEEGVRDLESYNEYVKANEEPEKAMAQVVIIIDELADLMMAAPSQIEESICRLAQMARAAGMHLIVATQRPSVDVITGVIKANIPSRIAFAVSSQVDSRTILDMQGAEKLVGKGDMLFNPMGMGKPIRVQGAFVSDSEVHKVIDFVKSQVDSNASYNEDILTRIERTNGAEKSEDTDELLPEAIELVVRSGQASVSMLQRRFRIGYNRAARIVDMMEARGIIGPQDGSRPRQVLMTEEELERLETEGE
ncbi:MAG: DNA translocase FtsK 4TM domain-containing protein [Anaerovoracaceae bacterium]|nr:DNA translocase FtsK [Bacillota bacterium]MDY5770358.1 DNA translocase FtsK [Anaerovoracaceae bacterium]